MSLKKDILTSAIISGYRNGFSINQIAKITGLARSTCQDRVKRYKVKEISYSQPEEHPHYYIVEQPNGTESQGVCKICFHVKVHYNSDYDPVTKKRINPHRFRLTSTK